jgi:hypothetical protein
MAKSIKKEQKKTNEYILIDKEPEKTIFDIGYILIENINTTTDLNKIKLLSMTGTYNKNFNKRKQDIIKNTNEYKTKYETLRQNNIDNYNKYLREKDILFTKWKQSQNIKDLYQLISIKTPEYIDIPDIYTINSIDKYERTKERKYLNK